MVERAIGVIDSGVGGLTVVHELMRQLPKEKLIYVGDTKRCPYGPRPQEEVRQFTWEMVDFLMSKNIKMLVVACNTATAFTLDQLQQSLDIPVIGVIKPGARAAIKATMSNHAAIIGTEGTINSNAYTEALHKIKEEIKVTALACPDFVPMVERGVMEGDEALAVVETSLQPLINLDSMDTLILGCTHYPLLKETIKEVLGGKVAVISSSEETARETSTILEVHQLLNKSAINPVHEFYTTGDLPLFMTIAKNIFNEKSQQMVTIKNVTLTTL